MWLNDSDMIKAKANLCSLRLSTLQIFDSGLVPFSFFSSWSFSNPKVEKDYKIT